MSAPEYKLTYFNAKSLGETIRWIFAVADVPFEDDRFEGENWPELKSKLNLKWGQVPVLFENGKEMTQSAAIGRYLAKKYKLAGSTDFEAYLCDQYVDHINDWRMQWSPVYRESDNEKRAEIVKGLLADVFPKFLGNFNGILKESGGPFLLGSNFTWADFFLANYLEIFEDHMMPDLLSNYPELKKQKEAVFAIPQIKAFIEKRPKTLL